MLLAVLILNDAGSGARRDRVRTATPPREGAGVRSWPSADDDRRSGQEHHGTQRGTAHPARPVATTIAPSAGPMIPAA